MKRRRLTAAMLSAVALTGGGVAPALAQTTGGAQGVTAQCATTPAAVRPSDANRRAAREVATRARETAITSDLSAARGMYEQAAALDATDPETAYALGRIYEQARDPRAITQYCRFLALTPNAAQATDVRRRVAALAFELAPPTAAAPAPPGPRPGNALVLGILFPGGGQYYTERPGIGFLITAATGGAVLYALRSETRTVVTTRTATDPFGNPYTYQDVRTTSSRPNLPAGITAAAAISVLAALEAYGRARPPAVAQHQVSAMVAPRGRGLAVGIQLAVGRTP